MPTAAEWVEAARPKTLPAAVAPVLVGTGAAIAAGAAVWWKAALALLVALALQVGVNYANDYSDGVRGTDAARVGPFRLVGSGAARPRAVLAAALAWFGIAAAAGLVLAATTTWWLVAVGAAALVAAWTYTGGPLPYGYRAFGELSVFVFFGIVAVLGTTYVQAHRVTVASVVGAVAVGALTCALLVVNNLRDLPTDALAGKRTLSVVVGERATRRLYAALVVVPFLLAAGLAGVRPASLLALVAVPLAVPPLRDVVRAGAAGRALLPALRDTGRVLLAYAAMLAVGLSIH